MTDWLQPASAHFDHAVRAFSSELYQYAYWLCRDRHRAEDILQEAFARAWKQWHQINEESSRRSWLYIIVRHEFLRELDRAGSRNEVSEDEEAVEIPSTVDFTLGVEVRNLLEQLPTKFLEPLLLQTLVGMSCEEIAAVMGISTGAVMTRLTRARLALHALMNDNHLSTNKPTLRLVQSGGSK